MIERVIRCTPDNAAEFRDLIKRWPELQTLIRHTQAQGLFPGLRALRITLTGAPEMVSKGLDTLDFRKTPQTPVLPVLGASAEANTRQE